MPSSLLSKKQGRRSTISVPGVEIVGPRTPYLGGGPTGHKLKARYDIACPGANGPLRGPGRSPRPGWCVHHGPRHAGDKGDGLGTGRDVLGTWPAVTPRSVAVSTAHQQRLARRGAIDEAWPPVRAPGILEHGQYLASGMTEEEILADFPDLEPEDIRAVLAFAAARERVHRAGTSSSAWIPKPEKS